MRQLNIAATIASIAAATPGAQVIYQDDNPATNVYEELPNGSLKFAAIEKVYAEMSARDQARVPHYAFVDFQHAADVRPATRQSWNRYVNGNEAVMLLGRLDGPAGSNPLLERYLYPATEYDATQAPNRVGVTELSHTFAVAGPNLGFPGVQPDQVFDLWVEMTKGIIGVEPFEEQYAAIVEAARNG